MQVSGCGCNPRVWDERLHLPFWCYGRRRVEDTTRQAFQKTVLLHDGSRCTGEARRTIGWRSKVGILQARERGSAVLINMLRNPQAARNRAGGVGRSM